MYCKSFFLTSIMVTALAVSSGDAAIVVTNGDFETPDIGEGAQIQDVPDWFDSTVGFTTWHRGESTDPQENGTQLLAMGPGSGDAYVYQSLGTLDFNSGTLNWSLEQTRFADGNGSAGVFLRFYSGDPTGTPADGTEISTLGLTQIGSDVQIDAIGTDSSGTGSLFPSGSVDLTGLSAGTQIWIELEGFVDGGSGFAPFDNISVTEVPEPASLALLGMGGLLVSRRRKVDA